LVGRVMDSDGDLLKEQTVNLRNEATNRHWYVITYGEGSLNSDPYYRENLVIGDLPGGVYSVWTNFDGVILDTVLEIHPGMVTYFRFIGRNGFEVGSPPTDTSGFLDPVVAATTVPP